MALFSKAFLRSVVLVVTLVKLPNSILSLSQVPRNDFQCPGEQGFYPHPEQCEKYYGCWNHSPTLILCPGQQLFDMNYPGCNWPELTDCQDRIRPAGYPNTNTPPPPIGGHPTTAAPYECPPNVQDKMYADPLDCSSYYRCVHETSFHFKCAPPLLFNDKISKCDYKENVDCGSRG